MKKIALALAAVSTLAITLPSLASAETVIIKKRGHHHVDRGWHHGHGKKVVVVKHGHSY